jgi:hypothetical protein
VKVFGGSYGVGEKLSINSKKQLLVDAERVLYEPHQMSGTNASVTKERKFGWGSFVVGVIVLGSI